MMSIKQGKRLESNFGVGVWVLYKGGKGGREIFFGGECLSSYLNGMGQGFVNICSRGILG